MRTLTAPVAVLCSLVLCAPALAAVGGVEVQGHRGARARLTENTLPAFIHALDAGVDVLELDVVATADDQLVVVHDPVLPAGFCTPAPATPVIRELTLAELQALDCGRPKDAVRFPDQQVVAPGPLPTLEDVFALVAKRRDKVAKAVRFNVEAKRVPGRPDLAPPAKAFAKLILDVAAKHRVSARLILQSFDHRVLVEAAKLAPDVKRAALVAESRPDYVAIAKAAKADIVSPNQDWITADDVKALHAAGVQVVPWTVNTPAGWDRMLAIGADGIITDDPKACIAHLKAALKKTTTTQSKTKAKDAKRRRRR